MHWTTFLEGCANDLTKLSLLSPCVFSVSDFLKEKSDLVIFVQTSTIKYFIQSFKGKWKNERTAEIIFQNTYALFYTIWP